MKRIFVVTMTAMAVLAMAAGCAGLERQSEEERILERLEVFKEAALAQDVDGILAVLADDFYHPEVGGKEQARLLLEMAIAQRYMDDGTISWADIEITVAEDGKTATAGPIDLAGPPGEIAVIIEGVKADDGQWYLTSADLY